MTVAQKPRVSIGLPIYNGQDFLEQSLDSLLAQTYTNFELIISDNGSTDRSVEIVHKRQATDPRIRLYLNDANLGAMKNFNRVFELARGEYFKWAAHDDIHASDYLQRCVDILDGNPDVVLAYARAKDIDENGETLRFKSHGLRTSHASAHVRFADLIRLDYSCEAIFGLMRTKEMRRTCLLGDYSDCDRVMLAELGLAGRFHEIPDYLFIHRNHANRSVMQYKSRQTRGAWFDPSRAGRPVFPYNRELRGFVDAIRKSRISIVEKMRCLGLLVRWMFQHRSEFVEDISFAGRWVLRPIWNRLFKADHNQQAGKGTQ